MTSEVAISRRKILAAIDLSEQSSEILREAKLRAEQSGGTWAVCHVLPEEVASALDGPPRDAIVDWASSEQAALVVIGTHGRTGLSRVLLGSVAESVVTRAGCSVEVVRLQQGV